jgi:hypothetical protein
MATEIISRKDAIAKGLSHYCTGHACKRGHFAPRLICNRSCSFCEQERKAKKRKKPPLAEPLGLAAIRVESRLKMQECFQTMQRMDHSHVHYGSDRLYRIGADLAMELMRHGIYT